MSRLSIEISPREHKHIKALAAMHGQSLKDFVMSKLFPDETSEEESWKELQQVLHTRIQEAEKGQISNRTVSQIANDVLGGRS